MASSLTYVLAIAVFMVSLLFFLSSLFVLFASQNAAFLLAAESCYVKLAVTCGNVKTRAPFPIGFALYRCLL